MGFDIKVVQIIYAYIIENDTLFGADALSGNIHLLTGQNFRIFQ